MAIAFFKLMYSVFLQNAILFKFVLDRQYVYQSSKGEAAFLEFRDGDIGIVSCHFWKISIFPILLCLLKTIFTMRNEIP